MSDSVRELEVDEAIESQLLEHASAEGLNGTTAGG